MPEARVKSELWVKAALRLGQADGRYGMVVRRGDPDAGGILVVLRGKRGHCVLSQTRDSNGDPAWLRGTGADAVDEATADAFTTRQLTYDSDLWIIEFESPDLLPPFDARIL